MGDSMEEKLDQDFLFYLTFTKSFFRNLIDKYDVELCQAWLKRLCSETTGVAAKRCRNIYLSQLVLAMQEGKLRGPFQQLPPVGHLASPQCVFGPEESPVIEVRLPDGGSLRDVSMRLAGGSDSLGPEELRFEPAAFVARRSGGVRLAGAGAGAGRRPRSPDAPALPGPAASLASAAPVASASAATATATAVPLRRPRTATSARRRPAATAAAAAGEGGQRPQSAEARRRPAPHPGEALEAGRGDFAVFEPPPPLPPPPPSFAAAPRARARARARAHAHAHTPPTEPSQVLDNLRSMLAKRPAPDDRKKVLEFYQKLIENVDAVWNGAAEPIPEVVNLMKKIQQGLKDVLPPLNAEQHSKTVLTILREKLVRRIAEVSERERKLADAEKFLTKPPEEVLQAELNIPSPLSDVLWNEAMNQTPKRQNLIKLQGMYDGALVENILFLRFIQLLAHEKGKIIEKFKKQYEKSVRCMKQNLQDRISYAVNAYVIAREDWAEISSLLENVQNAHRAALQAPGEPPSTEQWKVVNQLMDQLRESQEHYEGEIQRGEDLRMLLVAEHQSSHLMKLIAGNNLQQLQNDHSELCDAIHQLALEIRQQHKRIEELQNLLQ